MQWIAMMLLSVLISWNSQHVSYRLEIQRQRYDGSWRRIAQQVIDDGQYRDSYGRRRSCYRLRYTSPQTTAWSPAVCVR